LTGGIERSIESRGTLIFSCLRDKPVAEMAQILFPLFDQVILRAHPLRPRAAGDRPGGRGQATGTSARRRSVGEA
jgi:folylpolyglutamate synthase/dihydropteroate synthase